MKGCAAIFLVVCLCIMSSTSDGKKTKKPTQTTTPTTTPTTTRTTTPTTTTTTTQKPTEMSLPSTTQSKTTSQLPTMEPSQGSTWAPISTITSPKVITTPEVEVSTTAEPRISTTTPAGTTITPSPITSTNPSPRITTTATAGTNTTPSPRTVTTPSTGTVTATTPATTTTAAPIICQSQYSCVDCTTSRICAPVTYYWQLEEIARFTCPDNTWCDPNSGSCTAVMPASCAPEPVVGNFTCMREGYFPDPVNCSNYYHCEFPDYVPYRYSCPITTPYYDPHFQTCVTSETADACINSTSPCSGYSGTKVVVPNTDNIFIFCEDGLPVTVDRCIGAYQFNVTSQNCEPACPHAGLFPSDEDCTKYYRCSPASPSDNSYTMTVNLTCPAGQGFLEDDYDCVDKQLVPNCNASAPGLFNLY